MSFLHKRTNPLNRFFFQKFQEQVSKSSGFQPLFTMEDFKRLMEEQQKLDELENKEAPKENDQNT